MPPLPTPPLPPRTQLSVRQGHLQHSHGHCRKQLQQQYPTGIRSVQPQLHGLLTAPYTTVTSAVTSRLRFQAVTARIARQNMAAFLLSGEIRPSRPPELGIGTHRLELTRGVPNQVFASSRKNVLGSGLWDLRIYNQITAIYSDL